MIRQKQIANFHFEDVAAVGDAAALSANELIYVAELNSFFRVAAEASNTADGTTILATDTAGLLAYKVGEEGVLQGVYDDATEFPDAEDYPDKLVLARAKGGAALPGFYESNGSTWFFRDIDARHHAEASAPTVNHDFLSGHSVGDLWVNTLTSPRRVYICLDNTATAAVWEDISMIDSPVIFMGEWEPSSGDFPGGGTAQTGHLYIATDSGEVDGIQFDAGDQVIALIDNASDTSYVGEWARIEGVTMDSMVVAVESTYAALPDATLHDGRMSILLAQDGNAEPGLYYSNGTSWAFWNVDGPHHHVISTTPGVSHDANTGYLIGGIIVDTTDQSVHITTKDTAGNAIHKKVSGTFTTEVLTIATLNTVPSLATLPDGEVILFVNGLAIHEAEGAFTRVLLAITWDAVTAGYDLETTDTVVAQYITP